MASERWDVLIPESIHPAGPRSIRNVATFTTFADDATDSPPDLAPFDAVVVRVEEIGPAQLASGNDLKVIAKHGTGLDNVDVPAATEHGVLVCNTPAANVRSVAEHVLMLALASRRDVTTAGEHVRSGGWNRSRFVGEELTGDVLGLFGFGNISRAVLTVTDGFDLTYLAFDPYVSAAEMGPDVEKVSTLEDLFERSDIVSVHAPLTEATTGAISMEELELLGPSGTLINTARGGIVDESALETALEDGTIGGAGLDVFEDEPPATDSALFDRTDVVVTPHVAGSTAAALERMSTGAADNVRTVYDGRVPETTVNAEAFDSV